MSSDGVFPHGPALPLVVLPSIASPTAYRAAPTSPRAVSRSRDGATASNACWRSHGRTSRGCSPTRSAASTRTGGLPDRVRLRDARGGAAASS
jgi:hypothetical protein